MLTNLINALNKTINNAGGPEAVTGSVIQAHNQPIWYVNFLTRAGGTLLLEVIWRDGSIVASVLNTFKMSDSSISKLVDHFILRVTVSDKPPLYDCDDMPPLEDN